MSEKLKRLGELSDKNLTHILNLMWLAEYQLIQDESQIELIQKANNDHHLTDVTSTLLVNRSRSSFSRRAKEIEAIQNERQYPLELIESLLSIEISPDLEKKLKNQKKSFMIKYF